MARPVRSLLFPILMACWLQAAATEISGVTLPDSMTLPDTGTALRLNGAGIRSKFFLDIYVCALYLPERQRDAAAILEDTGAARVLMHFLYHKVDRDKIIEGWNDGFRANLDDAEFTALQPRLAEFDEFFTDVSKGDEISLEYVPERGTTVRINGQPRGTIKGNDFFRGLLEVWLGPHPVGKDLKKALLGGA